MCSWNPKNLSRFLFYNLIEEAKLPQSSKDNVKTGGPFIRAPAAKATFLELSVD
jgi:hypothetical protein